MTQEPSNALRLAAIVERDRVSDDPSEAPWYADDLIRDRHYLLGLLREARDILIHKVAFDDRGYSHVECGIEEQIRDHDLLARLAALEPREEPPNDVR